MSSAATDRTIKFVSKSGTYTSQIMSPQGDLYQDYTGTTDEVTSVDMNFKNLTPNLYFVATSSRVSEGVVSPDSMKFYFNGTEITFNTDGTSSGTFSGLFKRIYPSGDNVYHGLQIVDNLLNAAGFTTAVIKMVANVSYGSSSDTIQASYTIPIQKSTGTSYRVTIQAGDNKNFVLTTKGDSCVLKAAATEGGNPITKNLTYKWEKMTTAGWTVIEGQVSAALTVSTSDVSTYGEYRATVYRSGAELGKDIQGVIDASDPYDIDTHPSPEDETITEDESGNGSVTYTPVIVKRGTGTKAMDSNFFFILKDAAGVYLNTDSERSTAAASFTVLRKHMLQAMSDVSLTIISEK